MDDIEKLAVLFKSDDKFGKKSKPKSNPFNEVPDEDAETKPWEKTDGQKGSDDEKDKEKAGPQGAQAEDGAEAIGPDGGDDDEGDGDAEATEGSEDSEDDGASGDDGDEDAEQGADASASADGDSDGGDGKDNPFYDFESDGGGDEGGADAAGAPGEGGQDDSVQGLIQQIVDQEKHYYAAKGMHGADHHKAQAQMDHYHALVRKLVRALMAGGQSEGPPPEAGGEDTGGEQAPPEGGKPEGKSKGKKPPFMSREKAEETAKALIAERHEALRKAETAMRAKMGEFIDWSKMIGPMKEYDPEARDKEEKEKIVGKQNSTLTRITGTTASGDPVAAGRGVSAPSQSSTGASMGSNTATAASAASTSQAGGGGAFTSGRGINAKMKASPKSAAGKGMKASGEGPTFKLPGMKRSLDPIDALAALAKAGQGGEKAGHKYMKRTPDGKGGWKYEYSLPSHLLSHERKLRDSSRDVDQKTHDQNTLARHKHVDSYSKNWTPAEHSAAAEHYRSEAGKHDPTSAEHVLLHRLAADHSTLGSGDKARVKRRKEGMAYAESAAKHDANNVEALHLHGDHTGRLHPQKQAVRKNLINKMASGEYDHHQARKLWQYHADHDVKDYKAENGSDSPNFSLHDRRQFASEMADQFYDEARHGEYDDLKHKKYTDPKARRREIAKKTAERATVNHPNFVDYKAKKSFTDSAGRTLKKGLFEYGSDGGAVPDEYLYDYLCAFVEEAYEHEKRECAHQQLPPSNQAGFWAARVMGEFVSYMTRNKNLVRAAKKYRVNKASIASILKDKNLLQVPADGTTPTDRDSWAAMGQPLEAMAYSHQAPWVQADPTAPIGRPLAKSEPRRAMFVDDTADPMATLVQERAAKHNALWNIPQAQYTPDNHGSCQIHGREVHKAMNLSNPWLKCTCR